MNKLLTVAAAAALIASGAANARELSLAYFMGPKHPMNAAVFMPFAEKLAELSGGELTVKQYPGGALNSAAPKQYAIMLDGVADIVFTLPGYTGDLFPKTNIIAYPGNCVTASECTQALLNARSELEKEYNAKVLAIWSNSAPILLTRDKPVRTLEDLEGMKVRVTARQNVPFVEALGASAVAQPVTVVNQNLANGVIDAIAIDAAGIGSFKLQEPANYLTSWFPGSGSAFVLLMNRGLYDSLSEQERGWVDAASDASLSLSGGEGFDKASKRGIELARSAGVEIIEVSDEEKARFLAAIEQVYDDHLPQMAGDIVIGDLISMFKGM